MTESQRGLEKCVHTDPEKESERQTLVRTVSKETELCSVPDAELPALEPTRLPAFPKRLPEP